MQQSIFYVRESVTTKLALLSFTGVFYVNTFIIG